MTTANTDPVQEPSETVDGQLPAGVSREQLERCRELGLTPVPGKRAGRDAGGTFRSLSEPADGLTAAEHADIERQYAALLADLGPSPAAAHVIIIGQIRDVLTDLARLRRDVDKHGAFASNGRRLRSAFAAVEHAQDRLVALMKLLTPAKSGRKRVADPAAAVAAFNAAIDARKR